MLRRIKGCEIAELARLFSFNITLRSSVRFVGLIPISGITGEIIIKPSEVVKAAPCVSGAICAKRNLRAVYADEEKNGQFSRSYGRAA